MNTPAPTNEYPEITLITDIMPGGEKVGASVYLEDIVDGLCEQGARVRVLLPDYARYYNCFSIKVGKRLRERGCEIRVRRHVRIGDCFYTWDPVSAVMGTLVPAFKWVLGDFRLLYHLYQFVQRLRGKRRDQLAMTGKNKQVQLPLAMQSLQPKPEHLCWVRRLIERQSPDVLMVNYLWLVDYFQSLPASARTCKAIITHDLFHCRQVDVDSPTSLSRQQETQLLAHADILLAIQEDEAQVMRQMLPEACVVLCPLTVVPCRHNVMLPASKVVLFVGSMAEHNIDGLHWFLDEVWPLVCEQDTSARLHIAGAVCRTVQKKYRYQQVVWHDVVDDLTPLYNHASLVVCPLRFGSGLKIKVVEAFAHGKAVIGTPVAAQGLDCAVDSHAMCTVDDPQAFALEIKAFLNDPLRQSRMQQAAWDYVQSSLDRKQIYQQVMHAMLKQCRQKNNGVEDGQ